MGAARLLLRLVFCKRFYYVTRMLRFCYSTRWREMVQHTQINQKYIGNIKQTSISNKSYSIYVSLHFTHICRIKGCGGAGCPPPPPIIFERLKLPQQIINRRKENLSESPNHQKYWENILVSRFYEQFSRNRRNLGHFRKFEKISNS